ncbi:hypothetical protein EMGBS15_12710 [Filimonas sp.]|nr:hypothetical protein EMGBS15_12710 [Filimonas sp.]
MKKKQNAKIEIGGPPKKLKSQIPMEARNSKIEIRRLEFSSHLTSVLQYFYLIAEQIIEVFAFADQLRFPFGEQYLGGACA